MSQQNIKLILAYDGTHYLGWQKTAMGPSVEETLQASIERVLQCPLQLQVASRTDSGVHARGQVVNFKLEKPINDFSRFRHSINSLLPKDITVIEAVDADPNFHPTIDSVGKEYHYNVCTSSIQLPENRHFSWHYWYPLDISRMRAAALKLIGTHDFASFYNVNKSENCYEGTVREIFEIEIQELKGQRLCFIVKGRSFLYKMVRNIVGTLLYVGRGKISLESFEKLLSCNNRPAGGMTAPAHGLTLHNVFYPTMTACFELAKHLF